jgi:plastocyanin
MKYTINLIFLLLLVTAQLSAVTHTITTPDFNFSPNNITINLGDTINFSLGSIHNAREVSLATWNSNGTTSNGGFEVPLGGGIVVLTEVRTYYYVCVPHASSGMKGMITVNPLTGIESNPEFFPGNFTLSQNYPNPFNPTTSISFTLTTSEFTSLKIYNSSGQEVAILAEEYLPAGNYRFKWDAENMASGFYTGALTAGGVTQTRKMLLIR